MKPALQELAIQPRNLGKELYQACESGAFLKVKSLLASGAPPDYFDPTVDFGATPLIRAAANGHLMITRTLINGGASVNREDNDGHTAVDWASRTGQTEMVALLLSAGAVLKPNEPSKVSEKPTHSNTGAYSSPQLSTSRKALSVPYTPPSPAAEETEVPSPIPRSPGRLRDQAPSLKASPERKAISIPYGGNSAAPLQISRRMFSPENVGFDDSSFLSEDDISSEANFLVRNLKIKEYMEMTFSRPVEEFDVEDVALSLQEADIEECPKKPLRSVSGGGKPHKGLYAFAHSPEHTENKSRRKWDEWNRNQKRKSYSLADAMQALLTIVTTSIDSDLAGDTEPERIHKSQLSPRNFPELRGALTVNAAEKTIFDFTCLDIDGREVKLDIYRTSPVVLVVNVASQCGYAHANYRQLQKLYDQYHAKGVEILAFPCNQFAKQEPWVNSDIKSYVVSKYKVTFPLFAKVEVNGANQSPLFQFMKETTKTDSVLWNFTKFLVVAGVPLKQYSHSMAPEKMVDEIEYALETLENHAKSDLRLRKAPTFF